MLIRILSLLCLLFACQFASAIVFDCNPEDPINSVEELDILYESSPIVFFAEVELNLEGEIEDKDHPHVQKIQWNYSLIEPALKGEVEKTGILTAFLPMCFRRLDLVENGIFLIFWSNPGETIHGNNAISVSYGDNKHFEDWILIWAKGKAYNNTLKGTANDAAP